MNNYSDYMTRKTDLIKSLESFLVELSPLKTYEEGQKELALFESTVLNEAMKLYFILKKDEDKDFRSQYIPFTPTK
jgi:hypothetical protein